MIDEELKQVALIAIDRQKLLSLLTMQNGDFYMNKLYKIVDWEGTRPDESGGTGHLTQKYLERLGIMKRGPGKFEMVCVPIKRHLVSFFCYFQDFF
ncbi:MAG TPA: hypothetical protein VHS96_00405 [Bacteroidia bacterium]|nr:hypothetical protein [Bacteroidia bacterium]